MMAVLSEIKNSLIFVNSSEKLDISAQNYTKNDCKLDSRVQSKETFLIHFDTVI